MKLSRKRVKLILVVIVIITIILTTIIYVYFKNTYESQTIALDLRVEEGKIIGLNSDTNKLYFGRILKTGIGKRNVTFTNTKPNPYKINFIVTGELKDWITIANNNFILNPNQNKSVTFKVVVPEAAEIGNYTGNLRILYKKIKY